MNSKKFTEAMSELDNKYVDEAINYKKKAKKPVWVKWGTMAACFCLVVVGALAVVHPWEINSTPVPNPNGAIEREPEIGEYPPLNIVPGFTLDEPNNQIDPIDVVPSNVPSGAVTDDPAVTDEPKKTITVIDLSQGNPGEFAGDMHRPDGFNENIGSALALKMSITDDVSYKYSVLIRIPEGSTLEQVLSLANESLYMTINAADAVTVNISGDFDTADRYYYCLTAEQIIALAENGTWCLYVGSGQGDHKDVNWDTKDGINTYCELNGDMYVLAGGGIVGHPDIGVGE